MTMIEQFKLYCEFFEKIDALDESFESGGTGRDDVLQLVSEMLNNNHNTVNTQFAMCAALARSAMTLEIDDDAQKEWDDTAEYVREYDA